MHELLCLLPLLKHALEPPPSPSYFFSSSFGSFPLPFKAYRPSPPSMPYKTSFPYQCEVLWALTAPFSPPSPRSHMLPPLTCAVKISRYLHKAHSCHPQSDQALSYRPSSFPPYSPSSYSPIALLAASLMTFPISPRPTTPLAYTYHGAPPMLSPSASVLPMYLAGGREGRREGGRGGNGEERTEVW